MPFAMPLLVDKTKKQIVIVISPLNDLEEDQVRSIRLLCIKNISKDRAIGSQTQSYWINCDSCKQRCVE